MPTSQKRTPVCGERGLGGSRWYGPRRNSSSQGGGGRSGGKKGVVAVPEFVWKDCAGGEGERGIADLNSLLRIEKLVGHGLVPISPLRGGVYASGKRGEKGSSHQVRGPL